MDSKYIDKDGLIYLKYIKFTHEKLYLDGRQLFITPEAKSVFNYLSHDKNLLNIARINTCEQDRKLYRAPIFGIPFKHGLNKALMNKNKLFKSVYHRRDWKVLEGHFIVGSLVAHTLFEKKIIEFEAWQLLDRTSETFYVHGIIDAKTLSFIHFDGATMHHSPEEKHIIAVTGKKIKGSYYNKHFRIDGKFSKEVAEDLMSLYLPLEDLTSEFLKGII